MEAIIFEVNNCSGIITIEENVLAGGFGSLVLETIVDKIGGIPLPIKRIGIEDTFVEHGPQQVLKSEYDIDYLAICEAVEEIIKP